VQWFVSKGWHGWALVLLVVVAFDAAAAYYGGESMTDAARRWFGHGVGRWLVVGGLVYLAVHLTVLPYRADPLDRAYEWFQRRVQNTEPFVNPPRGELPPSEALKPED
jgi:hypothetical protein